MSNTIKICLVLLLYLLCIGKDSAGQIGPAGKALGRALSRSKPKPPITPPHLRTYRQIDPLNPTKRITRLEDLYPTKRVSPIDQFNSARRINPLDGTVARRKTFPETHTIPIDKDKMQFTREEVEDIKARGAIYSLGSLSVPQFYGTQLLEFFSGLKLNEIIIYASETDRDAAILLWKLGLLRDTDPKALMTAMNQFATNVGKDLSVITLADIREIYHLKRLKDLGYPIREYKDNTLAIRAFQIDRRLPDHGRLDEKTAAEISPTLKRVDHHWERHHENQLTNTIDHELTFLQRTGVIQKENMRSDPHITYGILKFQVDNALPGTGKIDDATTNRIRYLEKVNSRTQTELNELGFLCEIDGAVGKETLRQLKLFKSKYGIPGNAKFGSVLIKLKEEWYKQRLKTITATFTTERVFNTTALKALGFDNLAAYTKKDGAEYFSFVDLDLEGAPITTVKKEKDDIVLVNKQDQAKVLESYFDEVEGLISNSQINSNVLSIRPTIGGKDLYQLRIGADIHSIPLLEFTKLSNGFEGELPAIDAIFNNANMADEIIIMRDNFMRIGEGISAYGFFHFSNSDVRFIDPVKLLLKLQSRYRSKSFYIASDIKLATTNFLSVNANPSAFKVISPNPTCKIWDYDVLRTLKSNLNKDLFIKDNELSRLQVAELLIALGHKNENWKNFLDALAENEALKEQILLSFSCADKAEANYCSALIRNSKLNSVITFNAEIHPMSVQKTLLALEKGFSDPSISQLSTIEKIRTIIDRVIQTSRDEQLIFQLRILRDNIFGQLSFNHKTQDYIKQAA